MPCSLTSCPAHDDAVAVDGTVRCQISGGAYPAEQARIMRLLIERIDLAPDGISVTPPAADIRSLGAELATQEAASEPLLEAED
jgi:hypothetical protein